MAKDFFETKQRTEEKTQLSKKKYHFEVEIRRKYKEEKFKHLRRIHFGIGEHIKPMIDALPNSLPEILPYIMESSEHHKVISKLIVERIYKTEIRPCSEHEKDQNSEWMSYILPEEDPASDQELKAWIYLFLIVLENEVAYAPHIFERYFPILKKLASNFKVTNLLFDLIKVVAEEVNLNWVPIDELISLIELTESSDEATISCEEADVYLYLSKNYYEIARDTPKIKNRILKLLEEGPNCFTRIKPKTFFKICLNLTYHENSEKYTDESSGIEENRELYFHQSMLKGSLIKNLYKQIFYSSNENLRKLCLSVLGNLIIELDSTFMWVEEKFDPISIFETEIKNTSNSMQTFYLFCEIFLLSILNIPSNRISAIFEKEIDILGLILYILENIKFSCEKEKSIKNFALESLWLILDEGNIEIKEKVSNRLIENEWAKILEKDSDIVQECYKILQIDQ